MEIEKVEKLESEFYGPIRDISKTYAIDDPNFKKEFEKCVDIFVAKIPNFQKYRP